MVGVFFKITDNVLLIYEVAAFENRCFFLPLDFL